MGDILVKICGLTNLGDAETAIEAGADLLGFVFVPGTPRCVDPGAADWIAGLSGAETVGVFRDASLDEILATRARLKLDRVQLHGDEPDDMLAVLGPSTIRRVRSWQKLGAPPPGLHFGLAGGLTPETVADAVKLLRPTLVDVSSGVECEKGIKDPDRVREFIANARAAASEKADSKS